MLHADGHDEAKSRFSQLRERTQKQKITTKSRWLPRRNRAKTHVQLYLLQYRNGVYFCHILFPRLRRYLE